MSTLLITGLVAVVMCVALTAFLTASETVLTRIGVVRALRLNEAGEPGAAQLLWLVEHPARGLDVVLLLTVVARVAAASVLAVIAAAGGAWLVTLAAVLLALVSFVVAEVAPRTYTLPRLERVGLRIAPVVAWLARALHPLVRGLVTAGGRLVRRAGGPFSSDEELRRLIGSEDVEEVELEEDERAMIHSIFELGDTVCREIMVPRLDMVMVDADADFEQVLDTTITSGYSRLPVWRDSRDNVIGVVYAKDLLERLYQRSDQSGAARAAQDGDWTDLLRVPTFVPESKLADELLRDLQQQKVHLAIVVDEHGAVVGLVTIEDILEEIVGEIVDEFDHEEPPVMRLGAGALRVSARLTVHDLNELLDTDLPEEEGWDTVGGLLIGLLGRVPQPGEEVRVDAVTLVAERVQGRRVRKVLVRPVQDNVEVEGHRSR
ncbi:MAG: hemolysin family protein [Nitriliruptorales bacterium]